MSLLGMEHSRSDYLYATSLHVAVKRGRKIVLPEYPRIELYHISEDLLEIGVEQKIVSGYEVKVYNAERSVCDAVKFRNKVGIDVCSEVVSSYLDRQERNLSLLDGLCEEDTCCQYPQQIS